MPFTVKETSLPGVYLVDPVVFEDIRGSFQEVFKESDFQLAGLSFQIKQINNAFSQKGVLRGLHYQNHPKAMDKFIRVLSGEIFDVAVDMRQASPYYGKWFGVHLSRKKNQMLFIPKGFAHGFCVLSDGAELMYYCSEVYDAALDTGVYWADQTIGVRWPISDPILSEKDKQLPSLKEAHCNFIFNEKPISSKSL